MLEILCEIYRLVMNRYSVYGDLVKEIDCLNIFLFGGQRFLYFVVMFYVKNYEGFVILYVSLLVSWMLVEDIGYLVFIGVVQLEYYYFVLGF